MGPIASRCFTLDEIPVPRKINIACAYLFSRLAFAAGAWSKLSMAETRAFGSAVMYVWRRTTSTTFAKLKRAELPLLSDDEVINEFDLIAPRNIVRLARLNLLIRVVNCNNGTLEAVIHAARHAQHGWLAAVEEDFTWIRQVDADINEHRFRHIPDLRSWVRQIQQNVPQAKRDVKMICMHKTASKVRDAAHVLPNATFEKHIAM